MSAPYPSPDHSRLLTATRERNPLDLPEILNLVGQYLVRWEMHFVPTRSLWSWHPFHLVKCLLVCKTWNYILTPTLWYYCAIENYVVSHIPVRIPQAVLSKQSHLFRIFISYPLMNDTWIPLLECRNLVALEVMHKTLGDLELIRMNQGLQHLVWRTGHTGIGDGIDTELKVQEEKSVLLSLKRLTTLDLCVSLLAPGSLSQMLVNNKRLSRLCLNIPAKVEPLGEFDLPCLLEFEILTHIFGDLGAVEDLARRCRNLKMIKLTYWRLSSDTVTDHLLSLSRCLKDSCPELSSLTIGLAGMDHRAEYASDAAMAAMIKSLQKATRICLQLWELGTMTVDALNCHSLSIQSIHLDIFSPTRDNAADPVGFRSLAERFPGIQFDQETRLAHIRYSR